MKRLILSLRAIILALPGFLAWACTDAGADPNQDRYGNHVVSGDPLATETVALSFFTTDTMTACGPATGIRVAIASANEALTCVAPWAPAMVSDPYTLSGDDGPHYVADCFFVVAPGTWQLLAVETLGADMTPLPCCNAEYPESVTITSGKTTEFGVELQCALVGPGALDIYGYLERPPIIKDLDIYPSKFGSPCVPRFMYAVATDKEGDVIRYEWDVVSAPPQAAYKLWDHGQLAIFVGFTVGDYLLKLTVTDEPHGMFTALEFPIHVTEPVFHLKGADHGQNCIEAEPEVPADFVP